MPTSEKPLHIDIPVKLAEVKAAFSVGALMFEGDLPASLFHLQLIENDIARLERQGSGYCRLSHERGPRDIERRCVQRRTEHSDRQSLQRARRRPDETRCAN